MRVFLMHIGHPGHIDVQYTVTRRRSIHEMVTALPQSAPERTYFESDPSLKAAFPDGTFNCWGVPRRAEPSFEKTRIGDLVLIVPWIGIHEGGIHQIGVVRAKCPTRCFDASKVLWPDTPNDRLFPYLFFFNTEVGYRDWFQFLKDVGIKENWHPRGWYRQVNSERFKKWGGPPGYLQFLREKCNFTLQATSPEPTVDNDRGGGFGDPQHNKLVEEAAIRFVIQWYRAKGWTVVSVERAKCGYDLRCMQGAEEEHVEVKGSSGALQCFVITAGEVRQAKSNSQFRLFVVTNALSGTPTIHRFSGSEFLSQFSLDPLQFRATLNT